jgi:hypothetical protein
MLVGEQITQALSEWWQEGSKKILTTHMQLHCTSLSFRDGRWRA